MRCFAGIDPGAAGAVAIIADDLSVIALEDWCGDVESTAAMFRGLWLEHRPELTIMESVSAMPGQGVSSTFRFGVNLGGWLGILATLSARYRLVKPRSWQAAMFDPGTGKEPKTRSLTTARRLFPDAELNLKKHHGRSDALLLACYARQVFNVNGG
jgi:crossover junction endodeoxyribonuclease RuvC